MRAELGHGSQCCVEACCRVDRLFAVLEDVAKYTADYATTDLLAAAWSRICELLASKPAAAEAIQQVGAHRPGSTSWWRAVRAVAATTAEGDCGGGLGGAMASSPAPLVTHAAKTVRSDKVGQADYFAGEPPDGRDPPYADSRSALHRSLGTKS